MRGNKKRNTRPELFVRKILHALGYRYRLHVSGLPDNPDIVFRRKRKVIFVHGCFWHQHLDRWCPLRRYPKSNLGYWGPKLRRNRARDRTTAKMITRLRWKALVVWECELSDEKLKSKLRRFLGDPKGGTSGLLAK